MNFISCFTLGTLFLISIELTSVAAQVFDLTLENFDQFTKDKDVMLVEFYAPWCHHCQELAPEWEKAAAALAVNREFILGRADCIGFGKQLCDQYHVEMYPTIKLFRHGIYNKDYPGERKADDIVKFLQDAQAESQFQQVNNDPWQTGASFQNTYPMTTPPVYSLAQDTAALQQNYLRPAYSPTSAVYNAQPALDTRATTAPPVAEPRLNGNFWSNYPNNYWPGNHYSNQYNPQASITPTIGNYFALPQYRHQEQASLLPGSIQKSTATSSFQYNSMNGRPFQAHTETYQMGLAPPVASVALPFNTPAGAFQSQLSAQNNQADTFISLINGQPYAFRRIVNMGFRNYPKNLNQFQPFARAGPGFLRGDAIPHVMRESVTNHIENTPQRQLFALPPPSQLSALPSLSSATRQNIRNRSPIASKNVNTRPQNFLPTTRNNVQRLQQINSHSNLFKLRNFKPLPRYEVNKPNNIQMLSNFPKVNQRFPTPGRQQIAYTNLASSRLFTRPSQSAIAKLYQNSLAKLGYAKQKVQKPNVYNQNPGRYVVSIRGQPGSNAIAAFKQKAMYDPRFLSNLLRSRSNLATRQPTRQPYANIKQQNRQLWQQQLQRRNNLLLQNKRYPAAVTSSSVINVPQTDRALIRAKVLRPDLLSQARWAAKGTKTGSTRGNIVYVPRSAFSRLPPWYRPKLGPTLVKYVVKTADKRRQFPLLVQGKKKATLIHPAPSDIWHRIYNFYNKADENKMQEHPFNSIVSRLPTSKPQFGSMVRSIPAQNRLSNFPLTSLRNAQEKPRYPINAYQTIAKQQINPANNNNNYNNVYTPKSNRKQNPSPIDTRAFAKPTNRLTTSMYTTKAIPANLWDKRSNVQGYAISKKNSIPLQPKQMNGLWGTLKKKRQLSPAKGTVHGDRRERKSLMKRQGEWKRNVRRVQVVIDE